jgi:phage tail sheath gpL-like
MTTISIPGIAPNFRTPGGYAQIELAQGPANAAIGPRETVLVMPRTATGIGTVNTLIQLKSERDAALYGGSGSPIHIAARRYMRHGATPKLWCVPYLETSGTGATAAAKSFGVLGASGKTATAQGAASIWVGADECSYGYATSETLSNIAQGLVDSINAKTWLPVTAARYVSGTGTGLNITAKIKGVSQNTAIRTRTDITPSTGLSFVGAAGDLSGGVEGTTTETSLLTTALATLATVRKYYVGVSVTETGALAALESHIDVKSAPNPGLRSVGVFASRGTLAATTTIANARNNERMQCVWQEDGNHVPAELVGEVIAIRSVVENTDSSENVGGRATQLTAQYDQADWPTADEQNTAINEGITCLASNDAGAYVVMSVNTRSKNPQGTVDDFRACETHRMSVCDEFVDVVLRDWALNYQGKKLKDDRRLSDGTVDPAQPQSRSVVLPSIVKRGIIKTLRDFEANGKLQEVDASVESLLCQKSSVNTGRIEAQCELRVVDHAHQFVGRFAEVSPG